MDQIKSGEYLKQLRRDKALTQEQLAEQLGVSARTVSRAPERYWAMTSVSLLGAQRIFTQPLARAGRTDTVKGVTKRAVRNSAFRVASVSVGT